MTSWSCSWVFTGQLNFIQDVVLCHKVKIVMKWFQERLNITLIKWPGNSPDLYPIENVLAA
jgi:hypothetical protein